MRTDRLALDSLCTENLLLFDHLQIELFTGTFVVNNGLLVNTF